MHNALATWSHQSTTIARDSGKLDKCIIDERLVHPFGSHATHIPNDLLKDIPYLDYIIPTDVATKI